MATKNKMKKNIHTDGQPNEQRSKNKDTSVDTNTDGRTNRSERIEGTYTDN